MPSTPAPSTPAPYRRPALVASEATFGRLLTGGQRSMMDFIRENAGEIDSLLASKRPNPRP